jgi:predicted RNA binding protein YcfA (HicA-like mRNA interferase family)
LRPQEFFRLLLKAGFYEVRKEGRHIRFRHPDRERDVIVPYHAAQDLSAGLLHRLKKFDPEHVGNYVIEWLSVEVPTDNVIEKAA